MEHETDIQRDERIQAAIARGGVPKAIFEPPTDAEIDAVRRNAITKLEATTARQSADEKELTLWARIESNSRAQLEHAIENGEDYRPYAQSLAEALAYRGAYAEAIENDPSRAEEFDQMRRAANRPDNEVCSCADPVLPFYDRDGREIARKRMPKHGFGGRRWSPKHGGFVNLIVCLYCNSMNLTPEMPDLLDKKLSAASEFPATGQGKDVDVFGDGD